jgi:hypothetical protein
VRRGSFLSRASAARTNRNGGPPQHLLAVVQSVREFGRAITVPMGAPAGRLSTFIEVPFTDGDKHLRPDGVIQVASGQRAWTALVEVKTDRRELHADQISAYLDVARKNRFDALLTISNQLAAASGIHPVQLPKARGQTARLHHLPWSQIRTQALLQQANKSISDPDQAWILAELIRYLEHPKSGAIDFDDMGTSWYVLGSRPRSRPHRYFAPAGQRHCGSRRPIRLAHFLRCDAAVPRSRYPRETDGDARSAA